METIEDLISRMDLTGIKKHGRIQWIADRTGYSHTQVGDILRGKRTYTERFKKLVTTALKDYEQKEFMTSVARSQADKLNNIHTPSGGAVVGGSAFETEIIREAVSILQSLSGADMLRAVAMLKDFKAETEKGP